MVAGMSRIITLILLDKIIFRRSELIQRRDESGPRILINDVQCVAPSIRDSNFRDFWATRECRKPTMVVLGVYGASGPGLSR